jgi:hypothetical protein
MSVEHQPKPDQSMDRAAQHELEAMGQKQLEKLKTTPENATEHAEQRAEQAREIINKQEPQPEPDAVAAETEKPASSSRFIPHFDHQFNYRDTLASVQRKLSPAARQFSAVIHNPAIEKTSEALEKTVMRPSIVAGATWTAVVVGLMFYGAARFYGFALSGSELIVALLAGGLIGGVLELVMRLLRPKQR